MTFTQSRIAKVVEKQRQFFATGTTKEIDFRITQLKRLKQVIIANEETILNAIKADLNKPLMEAYLTEIGVIKEIDYTIKNIRQWSKPKKIATSLDLFPSSAYIYPEPLGVVLVIGPWNYPFQLIISPLVGAIAAGNCAVLKPSEIAFHTSQVVAQLINNNFDSDYITAIEGDANTAREILAEKFDHIFFTGGTKIGKIVMEAAAKNLTPITLELGGKSPCIVDQNINIKTAARRMVWGRFLNSGQTCVAPDYLLVDRKIKQPLLTEMKAAIQDFFGVDAAQSPDYGRIINERQFDRLVSFLGEGKVIIGGENNRQERYIAPTILDNISWEDSVMADEIFGPILPVLEYNHLDEAITQINQQPKPLALYIFSNDEAIQQKILKSTSSGGVCINDTIMQIAVQDLPFGGVGNSGIGNYHGKASFDTFSHQKSVLKRSFFLEVNLRYPPYKGKLDLVKKVFGLNS